MKYMASDKPRQTMAEYVTLLLSPALIIGLVGRLVFILLGDFYRPDGKFRERLQYILFFYVFGIVLVGRMSMGAEAPRSKYYGGVLAVLTYIGMLMFVEYPPGIKEISFFVNLILVIVVSWCAYRLV